jgi:lipopolysaccharide export system permease protein
MSTRLINMTDMLVTQQVDIGQLMAIILCLLPRVVLFSMPAACLMSVLLAFIRISGDNEIISLNASGISLYQIMTPVILFSLTCSIIACLMSIFGVPWGNNSYRKVILEMVKTKADIAIKERVFYEPFDNLVFYVNSYSPKDKSMKNIFVLDRRSQSEKNTVVAAGAKIVSDKDSDTVTIHFENGTMFTDDGYGSFDSYSIPVDLRDVMSSIVSREKEPKEMYLGELISNLKVSHDKDTRKNLMELKLYEMFSIPVCVFLIGIIGVPLGARERAGGRTRGIVISLFVFLAYYICLTGTRYVCEMGGLSPSVGVWVPAFFLLIACSYLMLGIGNYRPFNYLAKHFIKKQG